MNRKNVGKLDFSKAISIKEPKYSERFGLQKSVQIKLNNGIEHLIDYKNLYEIETLGSGEFGVVKKMIDKKSNLEFAVKIIRENLIESSENKSTSLMDLDVSIKLGNGSPYLIRFYGALYVESFFWILTEKMDTSIERFYLKAIELSLHLPESFYFLIAKCVLNALVYMKKLKVMHRDIKPSNILINSNGEIKICDFGISGFTINSVCKTFKGCQKYMAPEKIKLTDQGYSIKSDIWSLGISLIEIATGVHPFSNAKGVYELTATILEAESPKLDAKKFSKSFISFVDECLIKDAEKRPNLNTLLVHYFIESNEISQNSILVLTIIRFIVDEINKINII